MILTINASPTFDLTYWIEDVVQGTVNRVESSTLEASGKGINVSRALADQGYETAVIAPNSNTVLGELWLRLAESHHEVITSLTANEPRVNTSIVESIETTKINENLKPLSHDELGSLIEITRAKVAEYNPDWVVLSGSVNKVNSKELIEAVVAIAKSNGSKIAIDTSGDALREAIAAKPDFIKPNLEELQELLGDFEGSNDRFISAVEELTHQINGIVICSNGAGVGYASNQRELLEVTPLAITGANSVGAGDAAVAGFVAAESGGSDFITSVMTAKAWARKACQNPGSAGLKGPIDFTKGASVRLLKSQSLSA
jgi:1-phosphofructokinase